MYKLNACWGRYYHRFPRLRIFRMRSRHRFPRQARVVKVVSDTIGVRR